MNAGERIKMWRKYRKLTQKQLAAMIGVTAPAVVQFEKNNSSIRKDTAEKIADALNISVYSLLNETPINATFSTAKELLLQTDYKINCSDDMDEVYLWISYPDGSLHVTEEQLQKFNEEAHHYISYLMERMKQEHIEEFRPVGGKKNAEEK